MNYLNLLELLKRIAAVDPAKFTAALTLILAIAKNFADLMSLFPLAKRIMGDAPFIGPNELAIEGEIEALIVSSSPSEDGGEKVLFSAGRFDFAKLREIWLQLKDDGIADVLIAVLTRLLV